MTQREYATPPGGLPSQGARLTGTTGTARFTEAYAVIPRGCQRDFVTSVLPHWDEARAWILARPLTGFAETFAQLIVELAPGGGSEWPEPDPGAEGVFFMVDGAMTLSLGEEDYVMEPGSFAYLPPGANYTLHNHAGPEARFHWIRKAYEPVEGIPAPDFFLSHDDDVDPIEMPQTGGRWATTRFVDPDDMRHDMHVNIVTIQPGAEISFAETHVMEHGLYVLEGRGIYLLNGDWVEVEAGDFMWLRAFCPQACYAVGDRPFRYLLYKDVNRHPTLRLR
ncbi:MAG: bifunctional allantoicase/(S)-ureidoglycine aminohydrolase [Pseudomonadota bacterium]